MLLTDDVKTLLMLIGVSLQPKLSNGTLITQNNVLEARLDKDPVTLGIQEYRAWDAAYEFFSESSGFNGIIPTAPYDLSTKRMVYIP